MILIEDLTSFVVSLLIGIIGLNLVFFLFVLWRRLTRQSFFKEKDSARERFRPVVQDLLAGRLTPEQAIVVLSRGTSDAEKDAIWSLLHSTDPDGRMKCTLVLFGLGRVEQWSQAAFGRKRTSELLEMIKKNQPYTPPARATQASRAVNKLKVKSVPKSLAVDNLAQLSPEWALVFCAEGLLDPSMEVRVMAMRGLGKTKLRPALPHLFREMERCISEKSDLSLRGVKTALIEFGIEDLASYTPYLTHENPRFRFFVVDSAREICNRAAQGGVLNKNDFSPEFCEKILNYSAVDSFSDVRARAGSIVKHFRDKRAVETLRNLLKDENEFVRLHSVRACADRYYMDLIPEVTHLMKDPKWRVRESAAKAIAEIGGGLSDLYREFITTSDLYESEQIAEQIQRGGLMPHIVAELHEGGEPRQRAFAVCQKLAILGKTSLLSMILASPELGDEVRVQIIQALSISPTPQFRAALQSVMKQSPSKLLAEAAGAALIKRAAQSAGGSA
jgi:HEAT repeat protein